MSKKLEFKTVSYPEIAVKNICTCDKNETEFEDSEDKKFLVPEFFEVRLEISVEIPKAELADTLAQIQKFDGFTDGKVKVTIEEEE